MLRNFFLIIKYPYTAGIIAIIWLGSSIIAAVHPELPVIKMVTINMIVSLLVGVVGFRVVKTGE